ncbi:MAG: hypothetical protein U0163_16120 [Gemmatimonadaceae bacterium]
MDDDMVPAAPDRACAELRYRGTGQAQAAGLAAPESAGRCTAEPALLPVVMDLERGLRTLGVPFAVVGALVPELLLDVRPARMTNDADVTVAVESLAVRTLRDRLAASASCAPAHRINTTSLGRTRRPRTGIRRVPRVQGAA